MRKIFTLLIVAILATATSWAAEVTKTYTFTDKSWSATDESGNPANWKGSKDGNQFNVDVKPKGVQITEALTGLTVTSPTAFSDVKKVIVYYNSSNKGVGSINVKVGDTNFGTKSISKGQTNANLSFAATGSGNVVITNTCTTSSFALVSVKVVYEGNSEPEKTVKSLAITGEPTNKEYYVGGKFNPAGLVVTATYEDESTAPVTPYVTWTFNPTEFTEVAENVEVAVKAMYKEKEATTTATVSVAKAPSKLFIDLDKDETTTATAEKIEWVKDLVTVTNTQGIGGTAANNYYPGKGSTYKYTRFYSKSTLTFTPKEGFPISSIVYVAETTKYATTMANSTWTNATAKVEGKTVTISPTDGSKTISAKIGGTTGGHSFTILFGNETPKTLQSIAISGEPAKTEYTEGETFSAEGLVVTATYDDASTAVVTADAAWSFEPATLAAGTTSVTATAKYNEKTASETYNVTVKEIPTYTYTWMVNGAGVKKSVLKEGAAVEAPANPENIDGKVFTGWVTTATVDANVAPTYATIDETAKANTTYYAVFATLKQGAGEKWIKKAASEITEEGVYALITKDGYAFNGEIKSGDGQSTETTFVFDKNNEATSAPDGTCELTFVKKGEGYSINRDGTNIYKYLYSDGVGSGKLKWAVAEQNYWYYDEAKGSWAYKVKATETAYLNVYNTNNTFRTYYQAGTTSPVYFAQKVEGAGYADFTTIVKAAVTTLANLAVNGAEGTAYQVNDVMVVAKKFQKNDKNYIVVKDAVQAVRNFSTSAAGDKFFNINGNKQEEYTQNNWMLVSLPVELYNQVNEMNTVTSITGTLTEKTNVAMEATNVVFENVTNDFAPNTYCAVNFMGASSVKGTNTAYTSSYYFAIPKANEYANVVWAVYNSNDGAFYLPERQGSANAQEFKAAFKVDYSLNSVDNPGLTDGNVYSFEALVKEVAVAATDAKSAPRKVAYDSTVTPSTKFVVYPLDLDANKVATGVNDVNSAKEVKGVSYFNMMGVESAQPFDGVNIMVTTYTDGTSSAAKVLR